MKSTWFPHDYSLETAFPEREIVWKRGFESVYEVSHEGKPGLLYDGRLVLGFVAVLSIAEEGFDGVDEEALERYVVQTAAEIGDKFVELTVFDTIEERASYLALKYPVSKISDWTLEQYKKWLSKSSGD